MKEEAGRPCAGIYMPLYHQFDAPEHSSLSVPKEGEELNIGPAT